MPLHNPFMQQSDSLISKYASKMAESIVVKRAALEAKAARIEAELSIQARSQFLANMNHELRTPLNAIIGFTTLLRDSEAYELDEEKRNSYADYVLQSADLLLGHINTILETADLDGGTVKIQQSQINLIDLLKESADRVKIAAEAASVSVELKNKENEIYSWIDGDRIGQAVDHLLRIAIKTSPEGSRIFARVTLNENEWPEIAIRDNGKGLDEFEIEAALNAFKEDHRGLNRSFEGPGVELAVAKTFIEMQSGRFEVKSKVGVGTLITALLPPFTGQSTSNAEANSDPISSAESDIDRLAG